MSDENNQENNNQEWQQDVLTKLVFASVNEQRRTRRWNNFFKGLFAGYLFLLLFLMMFPGGAGRQKITTGDHTALIEIDGVISAKSDASADKVITGLRDAFEDKNTKGVILRINSPGGSPVQAGYINDEIKRLREKYPDTKLYAVVTDLCASGGYYIAAAADKIYVDKASLIGSIGVVMSSFGFVDALNKVGVERRLYTAGESKGFLDPFSPEKKAEVTHVKNMLEKIHKQFIDVVKKGRNGKLSDNPKLFTGLIWTGEESIELGLADHLGSSSYVAREVIKAEKIVDFTTKPNYLQRLADRLGVSVATTLAETLHLNVSSIR